MEMYGSRMRSLLADILPGAANSLSGVSSFATTNSGIRLPGLLNKGVQMTDKVLGTGESGIVYEVCAQFLDRSCPTVPTTRRHYILRSSSNMDPSHALKGSEPFDQTWSRFNIFQVRFGSRNELVHALKGEPLARETASQTDENDSLLAL